MHLRASAFIEARHASALIEGLGTYLQHVILPLGTERVFHLHRNKDSTAVSKGSVATSSRTQEAQQLIKVGKFSSLSQRLRLSSFRKWQAEYLVSLFT